MMRRVCAVAVLLATTAAYAADAQAPAPGVSGGLLQAVVGLAIVLALIWGAARLMRRLQPHMAGRPGPLRMLASVAVGQRERVVLIEVGEHWLVAGVAAGSVSALATLPKGVAPEPPQSAPVHFGTMLARLRATDRS